MVTCGPPETRRPPQVGHGAPRQALGLPRVTHRPRLPRRPGRLPAGDALEALGAASAHGSSGGPAGSSPAPPSTPRSPRRPPAAPVSSQRRARSTWKEPPNDDDQTRDLALRFSGVTKRFSGGTTALAEANLEVSPASSSRSSGRPGAASSTMLRIASGLDDVSKGTVGVGASELGYVFQDATLLPWRTVCAERRAVRRAGEAGQGRRPGRGSRTRSSWSASGASRSTCRTSCRAACGCGPRSRAALVLDPDAVPVRRAVRRARRDHPRAAQRRAAAHASSCARSRRCSSPTRWPRRCSCPPASW